MPFDFHATQSFGQFIQFDDNARTFKLQGNTIYRYDDLAGYDYIEEHGNMGHGGVARAFSVGFFGEKQGVFVASAMKIKITLKVPSEPVLLLNLLITPTKSNNLIYRSLKKSADEIITKLESIQPQNSEKENQPYDYTEELRRLRRLADEGVISEADFAAKKKQLLGL